MNIFLVLELMIIAFLLEVFKIFDTCIAADVKLMHYSQPTILREGTHPLH
ncbi:hypothetical protein BDB01DRAFT_852003 [Pilobolus umbonatus]|nr:hypothetical protein BDB01DRAFT_852003 [Pilobolus umbonatus]